MSEINIADINQSEIDQINSQLKSIRAKIKYRLAKIHTIGYFMLDENVEHNIYLDEITLLRKEETNLIQIRQMFRKTK